VFGIGVFEFIILLVLISTIGKVVQARAERPRLPRDDRAQKEIDQLNEAVSDLGTRLSKLEDERDFYRALLESPERKSLPEPPAG
jgi:hypothetical protein